jgi:hypothetical protein
VKMVSDYLKTKELVLVSINRILSRIYVAVLNIKQITGVMIVARSLD